MAKRRTKTQIDADKIIKASLLKMLDVVIENTEKVIRVAEDTHYKDGSINRAGGSLRDSLNGFVRPDTQLNLFQNQYGIYNTPKGVARTGNEEDYNALYLEMKKLEPDITKIIILDINEVLLKDFTNNKTTRKK